MNIVPVFISAFGAYPIRTDALSGMKTDRRTYEGKLRAKYDEALSTLIEIAWTLGVHPTDIYPVPEDV